MTDGHPFNGLFPRQPG